MWVREGINFSPEDVLNITLPVTSEIINVLQSCKFCTHFKCIDMSVVALNQ